MRVRDLLTLRCLAQFMMTSPTLRPRTSGKHTRTARRMALTTISLIPAWARLTCHTRAVCSRRTLTRRTCFPMPVLFSIPSSSVKRWGFGCSTDVIHCFTCTVLVRQAPGWTVQYDVFVCGACHPYVSLIAFFFHIDTPLIYSRKRLPHISPGREYQRDVLIC